jgi:osmoprotectant transport system permease protein
MAGVTTLVASSLFQWRGVPHWPTIRADLWQHVELTLIAVGIGLAISLPLGVLAWRFRLLKAPVLGLAGVLYIIPSVALFALLVPVTGIHSVTTAEIALVSYTLLILVMNTIAGLDAVPEETRDATIAMGYTPMAAIVRVYLPLTVPYLIGGLRVATTTVVGLVTVSAFIGLGGFGRMITTGFNASNGAELVTGLVLSVVLAALLDLALVAVERLAVPWSRSAARAAVA